MDLGTIKKQLDNTKSGYKTVNQVYEDILQVWFNCKSYFSQDKKIYQYCEKIEMVAKQYFVEKFETQWVEKIEQEFQKQAQLQLSQHQKSNKKQAKEFQEKKKDIPKSKQTYKELKDQKIEQKQQQKIESKTQKPPTHDEVFQLSKQIQKLQQDQVLKPEIINEEEENYFLVKFLKVSRDSFNQVKSLYNNIISEN